MMPASGPQKQQRTRDPAVGRSLLRKRLQEEDLARLWDDEWEVKRSGTDWHVLHPTWTNKRWKRNMGPSTFQVVRDNVAAAAAEPESSGSSGIVVRSVEYPAPRDDDEESSDDSSSIKLYTAVSCPREEGEEVQSPAAPPAVSPAAATPAERERLRMVAYVKDFAAKNGRNVEFYAPLYERITVTYDGRKYDYDHPQWRDKKTSWFKWLPVRLAPYSCVHQTTVLYCDSVTRCLQAMLDIYYLDDTYVRRKHTCRAEDLFEGLEVATGSDTDSEPGTPVAREGGADADAPFVEALRVARDEPYFKLHFWPRKLSLVDAAVFEREKLLDPELFRQGKHIIFSAPGRSGKSTGIGFGIASDLRYRRPVLFLTCQPSDSSYRSACRTLKEQLQTLGLYGRADSPVALFEFEDVRDNHAAVANSIVTGRRVVVCLRMDEHHLNLLRRGGFQLPTGAAVWLDEPQNKFTFKKKDDGSYVKLAVDAMHNLGAPGALFRAVSATHLDTLYWLRGVCGRDAPIAQVQEDAAKLVERNFIQDHVEHCAIDGTVDMLSAAYNYGLASSTSAQGLHPKLRQLFDEVCDGHPPTKFYGNYVMHAGEAPRGFSLRLRHGTCLLIHARFRRPVPRAQRGRPARHGRRVRRRVPQRHPHRGHGRPRHPTRPRAGRGDAVHGRVHLPGVGGHHRALRAV